MDNVIKPTALSGTPPFTPKEDGSVHSTRVFGTLVTYFIDLKCFKFIRCNSMTLAINENHTYSIQDAARMTGLPESTLRYYESIGILESVARDPSSGHRRYEDRDIDAAISVACLSATGLAIDDMRKYLKNRRLGVSSAAEQIELLQQQEQRLLEEAALLDVRRQYLGIKLAYWRALSEGHDIRVKELINESHRVAKQLRRKTIQSTAQEAA